MNDQNAILPPSNGPAPLENVTLSTDLDGSHGANRASGNRPQIAATNDIDAIKAWLTRFHDTKTTFDNYRKEAERLLLWSTIQLGKALSSLTHEDLLMYQVFLENPQPAIRWVMRDGRKFARAHPEWRPFAGPLSPASRRQAFIILNTLFSWLVNAGYLAGNPLSLSRQKNRKSKPRVTRFLEDRLWGEVKLTIEQMPRGTDRHREHYFRLRWLFSLMYLCGLRISEIVESSMGSFLRRRDKDGEDQWWLEILGKGDVLRIVPATSELMVELARYRREKGLSAAPIPGEEIPLLLPIGDQRRHLTRGGLHAIIKKVFEQTAARLRMKGEDFQADADRITAASAHWLRHTAATDMSNGDVDLLFVRDNLGHSSISTTDIYLHALDDERHAATEKNHKVNW
ncbi:site-specific integrase [Undibacterium sp. RTI2.1]|uniref:tyrosine-type recombinase/integrase n=1 Tax=unclassified Undibacterium TaxID=2630295 RepID=UPI002AB5CF06|nr:MULTISPECIES: site-specific integrase [unclassified Undibacterium]MDY7537907.1 site-specific integrase [Undibacterium sp. 5I1]MEB0032589.1 site-specific integrase [Undibacterium sp. RTI2.1]MEB0118642.1 site-specific integrase [Undibacterium sp. RTI2.2]MEB0232487.1 site-specific integrase [Undibacterium sp. 10I3]MEB0259563.1 site-specific integrase [Undibacterium sp. 5I1]